MEYTFTMFYPKDNPRVFTSKEFNKFDVFTKEKLTNLQLFLLALNGQWIMDPNDLRQQVENDFAFNKGSISLFFEVNPLIAKNEAASIEPHVEHWRKSIKIGPNLDSRVMTMFRFYNRGLGLYSEI